MNKLLKILSRETKSNVGSDILMMLSMLGGAALLLIEQNKIEELVMKNSELRQELKLKDSTLDILKRDLDKSIEKVETEIKNDNQ